jgi:hypothetical protein
MKYNPVDYIIDGYVIFRNKNIESFCREVDEKWREKVINLKGIHIDKNTIPLKNLKTILEYLTDNFGVFQVYTKLETICYLGKLKSINTKEFIMENLNPKGKWKGQMKFNATDIRVIEFDTDYINSLKLVSSTRKQIKNDLIL